MDTFQRNLPDTGLMDYRARFYSPRLGKFIQPDTLVPEPANPQSWNRYSYTKNNPINFLDISGHDDGPWWSTTQIVYNPALANRLSEISTTLQHFATIASFGGGLMETAGAVLGGAKGTTVGILGGIADGPIPAIELGGGLGGLIEGAKMGNNIHKKTTDKIEASLSFASSLATYGSDILSGRSRVDFYNDRTEIVIGQSSATALTTSVLGGINRAGVIDFWIDAYASGYSEEKLGGIYDLLGVRGRKFRIMDGDPVDPFLPLPGFNSKTKRYGLYLKFGDRYKKGVENKYEFIR